MPRIAYRRWTPPTSAGAEVVEHARRICAEYAAEGYGITLRTLYYQFVARDLFPESRKWTWTGRKWAKDPDGTKNAEPNYKWLGGLINDARLGGLIDWHYLDDSLRALAARGHWDDPADILDGAAQGFAVDRWSDQPARVEVWVEKDALSGPVSRASTALDVPYFTCRGYVSQSAMWRAGRRLYNYLDAGQRVVILHLGDHDPSGLDMTEDIRKRLDQFVYGDWLRSQMPGNRATVADIREHILDHLESQGMGDGERFYGSPLEVRRIALNMDQIEEHDPPPNPTKLGDSRSAAYIDEYGTECWELDALEPRLLVELITDNIRGEMDDDLYDARLAVEADGQTKLTQVVDRWDEVAAFLDGG